jgi:hypothetical protein
MAYRIKHLFVAACKALAALALFFIAFYATYRAGVFGLYAFILLSAGDFLMGALSGLFAAAFFGLALVCGCVAWDMD